MIISKTANIKINANNYKKYKEKGYTFSKVGDIVEIKVEDLLKGSDIKILCKCDECDNEKFVSYKNYIKYTKDLSDKYLCTICKDVKIKNTNLERYGCEHTLSNKEIREKGKKTLMKIYGVDNISKSENIKNIKKENSIEKWGFDTPLKSNIVREKIKKTSLQNHGVEYPFLKSEFYEKRMVNMKKYKKDKTLKQFLDKLNIEEFEIINYKDGVLEINDKRYNQIFSINRKILYDRLKLSTEISTILNPVDILKSGKEIQLINWLKELNIDFIESDKTVLNPKHLDIYIPEYNLAIEFNGLYWHSEIFKYKNYHLDKSLECQKKGIDLIHIWEDEWVFKQDIIKSIISNRLGLISNKIYARQCEIKVIDDSKLVREFLDLNHIQGYSQSSIKLGLFYNNELVSLMTFGYRHTNAKKEFELIRFCNKKDLNVIGAASKLFNYFKSNYNFDELISYSDFRMFNGKIYETLGFTKQHLSVPDYFWCKGLERKHRFNFNKQKLIKEGYDSNKTESEIMHDRDYFKIFGCGQYKWKFLKQL